MRYITLIFIGLLFIENCTKDSCEDIASTRYHYPSLPSDHSSWTSGEVDRYVDLPVKVAHCISTDTLIQSDLDYPYLGLFFAGVTPQDGYDLVHNQFIGLSELENRSDRGHSLLKLYKAMDPLGFDRNWDTLKIGHYLLKEMEMEIISSQYVNLRNLDSLEFNQMFIRSMEVYDLEKTSMDFYGYYGLIYPTTQVARMMLIRKYEPFILLYNSDVNIISMTETYDPGYIYVIESIHNTALDYLKTIKNQ
jgi:hypothetical protein